MINLSARKTGGGVVATLIRGDNHTTRLEIAVARNARDVDLGGLAWRVNICAADGRTDVYTPTEVVVDDREIRFGWLPGGIATAAVGLTEFTVVGMADAENPPVWKSDKQYLQIDDCVDAQPSGEQAAQLGELDKLIVFVRGELAGVLAAGKAAAEAAENARNLPFIGSDGMWRVWDAGKQAYVNTGVRAEGRDGAGAEEFADVKTRISDLENYEQRPFESTGDLVQLENYEGMPMDCVTHIEPVQAGSGDPYPAGGGKNLLNPNVFAGAMSSITKKTLNLSPNMIYTLSANVPNNFNSEAGNAFLFIAGGADLSPSSGQNGVWNGQSRTVTSDSEGRITIAYRVDNANVRDLTTYSIQLEAGSAPSAYAPYSNIRPISGRTSAKLTRAGKNLCGGANDVIVQNNPNAATVTYADNVFTLFTADGYADGFIFGHGAMKQGRKYTISGKAAGYVNLRTYNKTDMNTILVNLTPAADGAFSYTFEAPTDDVVFRVWVNSSTTCTLTDFQIEEGDRSEFEPYRGETFTADFGQTVYGGAIDWGKGVLTVDRALVEYKGTEPWNYYASGFVYNNGSVNAKSDKDALITSHYPQKNLAGDTIGAAIVSTGSSYNQMRFYGTGYSDANAWKAFLAEQYAAGTPVQVCYKLATPLTIQLTPQQITALRGLNYIWSDAGETTVSGRKDILWLTSGLLKRVAELEGLVAALTAAAAE